MDKLNAIPEAIPTTKEMIETKVALEIGNINAKIPSENPNPATQTKTASPPLLSARNGTIKAQGSDQICMIVTNVPP